jgi:signal transduction histidine kinase
LNVRSSSVLRWTRAGLALGVVPVAVWALAAAVIGEPKPGIGLDLDVSVVTGVEPGSPGWRDGIRAGHRVIELRSSDQPGGWYLEVADSGGPRGSGQEGYDARLRGTTTWAVVGFAVAIIAGVLAWRGVAVAAVVLPLAYAFAAEPLWWAGSLPATAVGGVAVFTAGGMAAAAYGLRYRRFAIALAAIGITLGAAWVLALVTGAGWFDLEDSLRWPVAIAYATVGVVVVGNRRTFVNLVTDRGGIAFIDVAYLAGVAAIAAAAFLALPHELTRIGVLAGVALIAYPVWRRAAMTSIERLLTGPARTRAVMRAIEDERRRLAREIHDGPLQDLASIIRRLETVPGTGSEGGALREVVARLRDVATALHPPVLQDLGLAAALTDLVEQAHEARPDLSIAISVEQPPTSGRPPADVELAAYRIAQEAIANAREHSRGTLIAVRGSVTGNALEVEVVDDGVGLSSDAARTARQEGHFGLDSMRDRAEAVDGELEIRSNDPGTSVVFRWIRR